MSFPRAKIQRFNEIPASTPSPADYNVELKKKVTNAIIPKGERFIEPKSPALSDVSSLSNSISYFRTPNPLKTSKPHNRPFTKTKSVELFKSSQELEALKEKIVECTNKDQTIKELTEQIEDMKLQLNDLETSICSYNSEKVECEKKIQVLTSNHETTLKNLKQKHQAEIQYYAEKIPTTEANLEEIKKKYEQLKQENRDELITLLNNINKFENLYSNSVNSFQLELKEKEMEIEELQESLKKRQIDQVQEIEDLNQKHAKEIQEVETQMLKKINDIEKKLEEVLYLQEKSEKEKINLKQDFEAKVQQMEENFKDASKLGEIQMKQKCQEVELNFKLKLEEQQQKANAILKECQEISEYNIIQCEIEKAAIKKDLTEKITQYETTLANKNNLQQLCDDLSLQCQKLQLKFERTTQELKLSCTKYNQEIAEHKKSIAQAENDKKAYDIALKKTHTIVEALKNRLLNSDHDVEQLKAELESTESSKLEIEERCNQLLSELQLVTTLYEDVELSNEKTFKVAENKIQILEKELLARVDDFKNTAEGTHKLLLKEIEQHKEEIAAANAHLQEQNKMNVEAQKLIETSSKEIERLEEENLHLLNKNMENENLLKEYEAKCLSLKEEKEQMLKNYECDRDKMLRQKIKLKEAAQLKQDLTEQCGMYEDLLNKVRLLERRNEILEKKISDQESLIGPFREQLEAYEMEYKVLIGQKSNIENEAKEMGLRYAELLGHQNQKQKIKYMVDLKKKNFELQENKEKLEKKVRSQARQIEKMKHELEKNKLTPKKIINGAENKENLLSPSVGSPGPLRERN